jgi:phosphoribosylformylglycinamidine synthase
MAFAGGLGVEADVAAVGRDAGLSPLAVLYSESNTRFVAEVRPADRDAFLSVFSAAGLTAPVRLGAITGTGRVVIKSANENLIDAGVDELRAAWKKPLAWE